MSSIKTIDEFWFYARSISPDDIEMSEEEIFHMFRVLRIVPETRVFITDGNGRLAAATITEIGKKSIAFADIEVEQIPPYPYDLHLGIAPTKNINRFEWFLEKATEIGIGRITPIITEHSERKHIRPDRLEKIIVAAMKQSKKAYKPILTDVMNFAAFVAQKPKDTAGYFAYLGKESNHLKNELGKMNHQCVLIGPEGGFSANECSLAEKSGFQSVSLGKSRLRTETAGIVASQIIAMHYE
ncbi:MAG: RsmE family RNA methyltransferase [Salinivirgaceae bacterium]